MIRPGATERQQIRSKTFEKRECLTHKSFKILKLQLIKKLSELQSEMLNLYIPMSISSFILVKTTVHG